MRIGARILVAVILAITLSSCNLLTGNDKVCQGVGAPDTLPAIDPGELQGRILYVSFRDNAHGELYVMKADGTKKVRLTYNELSEEYPSVSSDSKTVIFSLESGGIYTLDLDKCLQQPAGCDATLREVRSTCRDPEFSPDAKRIVFIEDDVMVMNADGSKEQRIGMLPATPSMVYSPTWGPDGLHIAAAARQQVVNLYMASLNESGRMGNMVWLARDGFEPAIAPDSTQVAMNDAAGCLCLVSADGTSSPQRLTAFTALHPTWSPDGLWIAFNHSGRIGVIDPQGTRLVYLTPDGEHNWTPFWFQ
ncbi:MAG: TolB family protein [Anaerolineae bacterium]